MESLAAMPEYVAERFADLSASMRIESGPHGSFAPVEQVWHLADLEVMGFGERISRLQLEKHPVLPDFAGDEVARQRNYKSLSLADGLEAFRRARAQNLDRMAGLTAEEWSHQGEQQGVGPVSLCDLPAMMAAHDESHRREIEIWLAFHVQ